LFGILFSALINIKTDQVSKSKAKSWKFHSWDIVGYGKWNEKRFFFRFFVLFSLLRKSIHCEYIIIIKWNFPFHFIIFAFFLCFLCFLFWYLKANHLAYSSSHLPSIRNCDCCLFNFLILNMWRSIYMNNFHQMKRPGNIRSKSVDRIKLRIKYL